MRPVTTSVALGAVLAAAACTSDSDRTAASDSAAPDSAAPSTATADTAGSSAAPRDSAAGRQVTEYGIGPVRAGMTVAEASSALNGALTIPAGADTANCTYGDWRGAPGVRFMIEQGRIARVDIDSAGTATDVGARVGDSDERVQTLYKGRVTVTPHKYVSTGRYLTVKPEPPADTSFRIVFETDSGRVVRYRSGRLPAVAYVERCG